MHIRPTTRTDIPQIAQINKNTFLQDELSHYLYPHSPTYPTHAPAYLLIRLRRRYAQPGTHGVVAETEPGDALWTGKPKVVGYAFFVRNGDDEIARIWGRDWWGNKLERALLSCEEWYNLHITNRAVDREHFNRFFYPAEDPTAEIYDRLSSYWHMALLAVRPECQRNGVGRMLVQYGQGLAEREGVPLTLESSVVGRKLYEKTGFVVVKEIHVDAELEDGCVMVWEPDGCRGKWLVKGDEGRAVVRGLEG